MAKKLLMIVSVFLLLLAKAGCGSGLDQDLIGVWECVETDSMFNDVGLLIEFDDEGRLGAGWVDEIDDYAEIEMEREYETWSQSTDEGTETGFDWWFPDDPDTTITIQYDLEGDALEILTESWMKGVYERRE